MALVEAERNERQGAVENQQEISRLLVLVAKTEIGLLGEKRVRQEVKNGNAHFSVEVAEFRAKEAETDGENERRIVELIQMRRENAVLQIEQNSMADRIIYVGEAVVGFMQEFRVGSERLLSELADSLGEVVAVGLEIRDKTPVGTTHNEERPPWSPCLE